MAKAAHDRNRTRESILTQATVGFSTKGYDGARVDGIAARCEALDRGVEEGVFRAGIDPITLCISLASLAYHCIPNQYTLQAAPGIDLTSREKQLHWLDHIEEMILAFCHNDGGQAKRATGRSKVKRQPAKATPERRAEVID